jgi:membrane protein implicated in regulation of membrane protease activity
MFLSEVKTQSRPVFILRAFARYAVALLASYFVAWTVAFILVTYNAVRRLDFSEYFHWLVLAWNFTGLEMVAVTWFLSILIFFPLAIASVIVLMKRDRRKLRAALPA